MELNSAKSLEGSDEIECIICWQDGLELIESECPSKHTFHAACLEAWLKNNSTCPYCSQKIKHKFKNVNDFFKLLSFKLGIKKFKDIAKSFGYYYIDEELNDEITEALNNFSIELQIECIKKCPHFLKYITVKTPELCRLAVENHGSALQFVPEHMKTPELCRLAVANYGFALNSVPEHMKTPELCRLAVKINGCSIDIVPKNLITPELCRLAVEKDQIALYYVPKDFKTPEFVIELVKDGYAMKRVPKEFKTRDFCLTLAKVNGEYIRYLPKTYKTMKFYLEAARQNRGAIAYIPEKFRYEIEDLIE